MRHLLNGCAAIFLMFRYLILIVFGTSCFLYILGMQLPSWWVVLSFAIVLLLGLSAVWELISIATTSNNRFGINGKVIYSDRKPRR